MSRWHRERLRWLRASTALLLTFATAAPGLAQSPTPVASPGPIVDLVGAGFPRVALGLPVLDVADARGLLDSGALAGRAVAIGGWWTDPPTFSCPLPPHYESVVSGYCFRAGALVGRPDPVLIITRHASTTEVSYQIPLDALAPVVVTETAGRERLHPDAGDIETATDPVRVVVIAHAADPRALECVPEQRADCTRALVVDRFAWVEGDRPSALVETGATTTWLGAELARLRMLSAVAEGGRVLTYGAWRTREAQDVDPRLGTAMVGRTWIGRAIDGQVTADGTAPLSLVTLDALLHVTGTLPMAPAAADVPAAVFVGATDLDRNAWLEVVGPDGTVEYHQRLNGSWTRPPVLAPGDHMLLVAVGRRAARKLSPEHASCKVDLSAHAGATYDVLITAERRDCTITVGPAVGTTPPPSLAPSPAASPAPSPAPSASAPAG